MSHRQAAGRLVQVSLQVQPLNAAILRRLDTRGLPHKKGVDVIWSVLTGVEVITNSQTISGKKTHALLMDLFISFQLEETAGTALQRNRNIKGKANGNTDSFIV